MQHGKTISLTEACSAQVAPSPFQSFGSSPFSLLWLCLCSLLTAHLPPTSSLVPVALWLVYGTSLYLNPKTSLWSKWKNYSQSKHFAIYALPFLWCAIPYPICFLYNFLGGHIFSMVLLPVLSSSEYKRGWLCFGIVHSHFSPSLTGTRGAVLWRGLPCQVGWDHTLKWLFSMHLLCSLFTQSSGNGRSSGFTLMRAARCACKICAICTLLDWSYHVVFFLSANVVGFWFPL